MKLNEGCKIYSIVHEFLHALGFLHMHSAAERDDFVTIMWDNIREGRDKNFNKRKDTDLSMFGTSCNY